MKNICEYCGKELTGSGCAWDYNWLYVSQAPDQEVSRDKMDIHYFCDVDCLVKWQKQEGIYDAAKKKSIERSGADTKIPVDKSKLSKGFRYRKPKDNGRDRSDHSGS